MLTQSRLKEIFKYSPKTGLFTYLVTRGNCKKGTNPLSFMGGYLFINIDKVRYSGHDLAWLYMTGHLPKDKLVHINGVQEDIRFINLKEAS